MSVSLKKSYVGCQLCGAFGRGLCANRAAKTFQLVCAWENEATGAVRYERLPALPTRARAIYRMTEIMDAATELARVLPDFAWSLANVRLSDLVVPPRKSSMPW